MICNVKTATIFVVFLSLIAADAYGAGQDDSSRDVSSFQSWFAQPRATGDWAGARSALEDRGVRVSSNYTADIGGNPAGGLKQTAKYSGFLDLGFALNFEKLASIKGLCLTISNYLATGRDLSAAIGNYFGAQEIYTVGNYYFGQLDLSYAFMDDTMTLEAGRLFAGDVFATSHIWEYYVNSGVNGHLNSISGNIFFPVFKVTAWAARATYQPNINWRWSAGIYNADQHVSKIDNHGADFSFDMDDGYLAIGQLTYKHDQTPEENGLPGSSAIGCYYESSEFQDLANPAKRYHGNYGVYLMWDQMFYRGEWPKFEGPEHLSSEASAADKAGHPYHQQTAVACDRPTGLTAWGAAYLAPQDHINQQTYELAGGLQYQGLIPSRKRDVTAFCAILGHFSDRLNGQGIETVLELDHRFQLGPWFYITPDVQYIVNPNGRTSTPNALVLGFETSVTF